MSRSSLSPLLALVCVVVAASIASAADKDIADVIKNRLNQEVSILHLVSVEKNEKGDAVHAVISLGAADTPQEKVYDCKFEISESTNGSQQKTLEKFNCEAFEVPYNAAPPRPVLGGWNPTSINDNGLQGAIGDVINALRQRNPPLRIFRVNKVEYQVVNGINYRLTMQASTLGANAHVTHVCRVVVFIQYWSNFTKVTDVDCDPMGPAPYVGGWQKAGNNDVSVLNAAKFAIKTLNSQCNCLFRKSFTDIVSASKQLVNGWKYKIVWKIGESTCRNNEENSTKDLTECPLKSEDNVSTCHITVWEHSMGIKPYYSLLDHNC